MLSREDNDLITQTNPATPMGNLIRRYWVPALLSEEIPQNDCPPVRVKLMGEELVAFRDSQGRIGLLGEHCAHRGTSLFFGRNEECGLRCIYHGWKYDVNGNVLETPAEPGGSDFTKKLHHTAYPTHEANGVIYAYLGPREKLPLFPNYEWTQVPLENSYVTKCLLECNYLQGLEGECDSSHLSFLHRNFTNESNQPVYKGDPAPVYDTQDTDFGVRLIATTQFRRAALRPLLGIRHAGLRLRPGRPQDQRARRLRNSHLCAGRRYPLLALRYRLSPRPRGARRRSASAQTDQSGLHASAQPTK